NCDQLLWAGNVGFESHDRGQNRKSSKSANVFRFAPESGLPDLKTLPPPAFCERRHRGLARWLVAMRRAADVAVQRCRPDQCLIFLSSAVACQASRVVRPRGLAGVATCEGRLIGNLRDGST